jgi:hypothetical protein
MEAKLKANELVGKFKNYSYSGRDNDKECRFENAKQCALIAVDEILESCYLEKESFFEEVKIEIEKL